MRTTRDVIRCGLLMGLGLFAACGPDDDPVPMDDVSVTAVEVEQADPAYAGHEILVRTTVESLRPLDKVGIVFLLVHQQDLNADKEDARTVVVGGSTFEDVAAGTSVHEVYLTIPSEVEDGTWVLMQKLDPANEIWERNEDDNQPMNSVQVALDVDASKRTIPDIVLDTARIAASVFTPNLDPSLDPDATGWSPELEDLLEAEHEITDLKCDHQISVTLQASLTGGAPQHDVDVDVALVLPEWIEIPGSFFDFPLGAVIALYNEFAEKDIPMRVPLDAYVDGNFVGTGPDDPGVQIPQLIPGDPCALQLSVCVPGPLVESFNQAIEFCREQAEEVYDWVTESLEITLEVSLNARGAIEEFEDGFQRGSAAGSDNTISLRINVFETILDSLPNDEPVHFGVDFDENWTLGKPIDDDEAKGLDGSPALSVGLGFHTSAGIDENGAYSRIDASLPLEIFGEEFEVLGFDAHSEVWPRDTSRNSLGVDVRYLGQTLYSTDGSTSYSDSLSFEKKKEVTRRFVVAVVPISATFAAGGSLGFEAEMNIDPVHSQLGFEVTPFANFTAEGSVGVELIVARLKVGADLTFVEIRWPTTIDAGLTISNDQLIGTLRLANLITLQGPHGELFYEATVGLPPTGRRFLDRALTFHTHRATIFEFDTFEFTDVLSARETTTTIDLN